jgi:hypothetical protein
MVIVRYHVLINFCKKEGFVKKTAKFVLLEDCMRIWKLFTLTVIFAIAGIAFTACDNGIGVGGSDSGRGSDTGSGTDLGEKIIGTWVTKDINNNITATWVFNADGNLTRQQPGDYSPIAKYSYGVADTKLVMANYNEVNGNIYGNFYNIYLSPDGTTLILTTDSGSVSYLLIKQ